MSFLELPLEVIDCEQGTPEWHAARCGIVTASKFSDVMAKGQGKTRTTYLYELAGEILTGKSEDGYKNADMARGNAMEPEARALFEATTDSVLTQVGFLKRGQVGASPDSLIDDDGILEIKTKKPALQLALLESGTFPTEHKAQVQGLLMVSGRRYAKFMSYWPGLKPFICTVERDEAYIENMAKEVQTFVHELNILVRKHKTTK